MNTPGPVPYLQADELRGILDDAMRFWELRRIPYNLILAAVVIVWLVANGRILTKRCYGRRFSRFS